VKKCQADFFALLFFFPVVRYTDYKAVPVNSKILTGFHAIEEHLRRMIGKPNDALTTQVGGAKLLYANPGPRVKKIVAFACGAGFPCTETSFSELDSLVVSFPEGARDHRGLVLVLPDSQTQDTALYADIGYFIDLLAPETPATVVALDSITDPYNVGAILRSCDQFAVSLVLLPRHRGLRDAASNETVNRASAGASSWVSVCETANLTQSVGLLKDAGFWVYGADAQGIALPQVSFAPRSVLVLGSEGSGISRLLSKQCDSMVSIPTHGKIDSLNVSVAAGILLYEISRNTL
jgi:23S rRNA (guanosine2251-2'-O)-methyltransferase